MFIIYKILFVVGLLFYSILQKRTQVVEDIVELLLIFFTFTPGFGIQWFLWLIPFIFLSKKPMISSFFLPILIALTLAYISWIAPHIISEGVVSAVLLLTSAFFPLYVIFLPQLTLFKKWIP